MTRNTKLSERIREVLLDGKWIANTNFKDQLLNISLEQAIQKVDGLNTIAMLTFHVNYYMAGILNVLNGGELEINDKYSFELPEIRSEKDWEIMVSEFIKNAEEFADKIEKLDESILDKPFAEEKYGSYLRNLEGFIEHSYYHLGQISIIKKMVSKNN